MRSLKISPIIDINTGVVAAFTTRDKKVYYTS